MNQGNLISPEAAILCYTDLITVSNSDVGRQPAEEGQSKLSSAALAQMPQIRQLNRQEQTRLWLNEDHSNPHPEKRTGQLTTDFEKSIQDLCLVLCQRSVPGASQSAVAGSKEIVPAKHEVDGDLRNIGEWTKQT